MKTAVILSMLLLAGCAEAHTIPEPDAGVCDPAAPCCNESGQLRAYGEPCGSGQPIPGCSSESTEHLPTSACGGVSEDCHVMLVNLWPRADFECIEGYMCDDGRCLWSIREGGR